ncbi:MAG: helix-turn-helix transcriptional regulator, partial [Actinobacteria bacterium]|nr:helix-turn-helix transcriptional regulator [Actinomycetota bacterium]
LAFEVDTDAGPHRVSWHDGALILHDHDLEAEQVLRALGGEVCPCLLILDALRGAGLDSPGPARLSPGRGRSAAPPHGSWFGRLTMPPAAASQLQPPRSVPRARDTLRRFASDPRLQQMPAVQRDQILSRLRQQLILDLIPEDMTRILGDAAERRRERRMRSDEQQARPEQDVAALLAEGLTSREIARQLFMSVRTVEGHVERVMGKLGRQGDAEQRLRRAAVPAFEGAIQAARRDLRPWASITVECSKAAANDRPMVEGLLTANGCAAALRLPVGWLNRVACRGLAVVDGHFVAWVDQPAPATVLTGLAVRWERRRDGSSRPLLVPCSIRRWPAGWELRWEE